MATPAPLRLGESGAQSELLRARAAFELGRTDLALPLVQGFRSQWPQHVGACVLATRVHLAAGALNDAAAVARHGLALEPGNGALRRLTKAIAVARGAIEAPRYIEVINDGYLRARTDRPSRRLRNAAHQLQGFPPGSHWARDPQQATIAFFHHALDLRAALRNYEPELIDMATRFGYVSWPRLLHPYVRGRSVLDVGCGVGGFGPGFLVAGATAYVGMDPAIDLDSTRARNRSARRWDDMSVTLRQMADRLPALRFTTCSPEDERADGSFETVVVHRLPDEPQEVRRLLDRVTGFCRPDGHVVLRHRGLEDAGRQELREITGRFLRPVRWEETPAAVGRAVLVVGRPAG